VTGVWRWALAVAALALAGCAHAPMQARCDLAAPSADKAGGAACAVRWMDRNLRLNDLVSGGTHNSYKQAIPPALFALVKAANSKAAATLEYQHPPLTDELDDGARQIELDVYYDPQGGRYANPVGARSTGEVLPASFTEAMAKPGFKVLHVQDIDFHSSCFTFVACLGLVRVWSQAHAGHTPILIMLNAKDDPSPAPGGVDALKFDAAAYDALDREIASVFPRSELITPDDVQGRYPTLRDAVLAGNWPKLKAARGKVLFALDEGPAKVAVYRGARGSLEGRLMFINTDETSPAAAYMTLNDPIRDGARIRAAVASGFIVRTRADADTMQARANSTASRDAAFASGAQWVSTDYRHPDQRFGPYEARLPGKEVTACNPVRAATKCGGLAVESLP
jgi:hypothetical protein